MDGKNVLSSIAVPSSTVTSDVYFATTELTLTCAIKIALELGSVGKY